jgi:hypothetical protein
MHDNKMITLLRCVRHWLHAPGWRRGAVTNTGHDLARDLELPPDVVSKVLDQAAADLRNIGTTGAACDAFLVINKAISSLANHGFHARPLDEAALTVYLQEVPEPHVTILRHYREGMKYTQIAVLMNMDKAVVLRSLVKTYADLRMKMIGGRQQGKPDAPVPRARQKPRSAVGRR